MKPDKNCPGNRQSALTLRWSKNAPLGNLSADPNQLAASAIIIEDILRIKDHDLNNKHIFTLRILNGSLYVQLYAGKDTQPDLERAENLLCAAVQTLREAQRRDYLRYAEEVAAQIILKKWNSDQPISSCDELIGLFDSAPAIRNFIRLLCDLADG